MSIRSKTVEFWKLKANLFLKDEILSFELGEFNKELDLIIDPVLIFATYAGSPTDNFGDDRYICI